MTVDNILPHIAISALECLECCFGFLLILSLHYCIVWVCIESRYSHFQGLFLESMINHSLGQPGVLLSLFLAVYGPLIVWITILCDVKLLLPHANEVWGKVILLLMFVCSQGGLPLKWGGSAYRGGGLPTRGGLSRPPQPEKRTPDFYRFIWACFKRRGQFLRLRDTLTLSLTPDKYLGIQ